MDEKKSEYDDLYEHYNNDCNRFNETKADSAKTVADALDTINLFTSKPKEISNSVSRIRANYLTFQDSKDLIKEEHKKEAFDGIKALALGGGVFLTFKQFVSSQSDSDDDSSTNIVVYLVLAALFVIYLFLSIIKRHFTTVKKALENTEAIQEEINSIHLKRECIDKSIHEISNLRDIVLYNQAIISSFGETDYGKLTDNQQIELHLFNNNVESLSKKLIEDI